METAKLSSKGRVLIPKALRHILRWEPGLELLVIDTGDGLLLKPKAPFATTQLSDVAGMFRDKVVASSDANIAAALTLDMRRRRRVSSAGSGPNAGRR